MIREDPLTMNLQSINYLAIAGSLLAAACVSSCSPGGSAPTGSDSDSVAAEKVVESPEPERIPRPGDEDFKFESNEALKEYITHGSEASKYSGGILPVIAREVPEYAEKLIANQHPRFIVVDKASMRVLLYDCYGKLEREYDMACAKNYGTKHKKADARTPEGFFEVEGIYNSTDWLFTDDEGNTSQKKGQFGPRFIRIKIPTTSQIGIHGTCAPWSIGHRTSHGCIRLTNDHILELVELVEPGMPVVIIPGKRDRAVNREEGYEIAYFPTAPQYAMSSAERNGTISENTDSDINENVVNAEPSHEENKDSIGYVELTRDEKKSSDGDQILKDSI